MGKRKKKGRPSLLDLQKRSLRLQKQQELLHSHSKTPNTNPEPNPNSNPNPYLRFPHPAPPRRATRRNPDPPTDAADDDDDDEDDGDGSGGGKPRREKKLKLVLRLPHDSDPAARRIRQQVPDKTRSPAAKATDGLQGEPSDSGPTTPLPDKELLVFILDRLQKKDTYGVFSEPVDLNELPDYLDIIDHPMDFGTVRKKLSSGAYHNLEQFEKDVFLISSNAMTYNAPDTIYYRQARAIQELAKKDFENLRQESDDNEPEPKTVRRGRPPGKATTKRTPGKSADHVASDFSSDATLANARDNGHWSNLANDLSRKGLISDKPGIADVFARSSYGLRSSETYCWTNEHKSERNEEHTGSAMKGVQTKYGKKPTVIDENRRNTYRQPLPSTCTHGPPILSTFDGERKQLVPVGLYMEHAYARSLARFAANLGPIGWEIAAQRIQRALPPGTKFGRGWVGESEAPQESQGPLLSSSPPHPSSQPKLLSYPATSRDDNPLDRQEPSHSNPPVEDGRSGSCYPPATAEPNRSSDAVECTESTRGLNYDERSNLLSGSGMRPKTPFHLRQSMIVQPTMNGLNAAAFGFDLSAQSGKMVRPIRPPGSFSLEASRMQGGMLDGVSRSNNSFIHQSPRSQVDVERVKTVNNPVTLSNRLSESSPDSQGPWRGLSQNPKPVSAPPDLNVSFQSPSSPASGALVDLQQPDLALQL